MFPSQVGLLQDSKQHFEVERSGPGQYHGRGHSQMFIQDTIESVHAIRRVLWGVVFLSFKTSSGLLNKLQFSKHVSH